MKKIYSESRVGTIGIENDNVDMLNRSGGINSFGFRKFNINRDIIIEEIAFAKVVPIPLV